MDAQQFLAEFGHIASAPSGVSKLRELVLVLAVQGRLVAQAEGEHSGVLLGRIEEDKRALVTAGAIRPPKPLPEVGVAERAHPIPDSWAWVRFGSIAMHNSGKTLDSMRNSGRPRDYITTSNLYWGRFDLSNVKRMLIRDEEVAKCTAKKNDLLICEGGEAGRAAVWTADAEVCFQNHIHRARFYGEINPFFAYRFLEKLNATGEINAHRKGIGISNLSSKALAMIAMPLPPLEEQSRIVVKVDELMAVCDKLETQQQDHRKLRNNLRHSTLRAVAAASSPRELQTTWERLEFNFGKLFSAPDDVTQFRGLVLDLAVAGLLLPPPQHRNSSASTLLASITATRSQWARSAEGQEQKEALSMLRKVRTQRVAPPTDTLPEHWRWATLLQVSQAVVAPYVADGIPLIRTTDIRNGRMELSKARKISEETYAYWARRMPPKAGDIFLTREAPMGEAAIVPPGARVCLGQRTMLIRLFDQLISNRFLLYVIQSPSFQRRMIEAAIGMAVKHLRVGGVEDLMVPVPPKHEQDQIVDVVDRLFQICDQFERSLARRQVIASSLALSAVADLTGIAIARGKDESVKAPQTELIASLRIGAPPDMKAQAPLSTLLARHSGEMSARDLWQRFGGEVDAFYAQLKTEVAHGWILEPAVAEMREKFSEAAGA